MALNASKKSGEEKERSVANVAEDLKMKTCKRT